MSGHHATVVRRRFDVTKNEAAMIVAPAATCWWGDTNWGGGGHCCLFLLIPNMACVLLLLSCQIVRLQAAGSQPGTSAARVEGARRPPNVRCCLWRRPAAAMGCDITDMGVATRCSRWFTVLFKGSGQHIWKTGLEYLCLCARWIMGYKVLIRVLNPVCDCFPSCWDLIPDSRFITFIPGDIYGKGKQKKPIMDDGCISHVL